MFVPSCSQMRLQLLHFHVSFADISRTFTVSSRRRWSQWNFSENRNIRGNKSEDMLSKIHGWRKPRLLEVPTFALLSCYCRVPVVFLSRYCRVTIALLSWYCRVPVVLLLSRSCRVTIALLSCYCRATVVSNWSYNEVNQSGIWPRILQKLIPQLTSVRQ